MCVDLVLDLLHEAAVVLVPSWHWLGPRAQRTWLRRLELELHATPPCVRPGPVQTQVFRSLATRGSAPVAARLDDLRPLWLRVLGSDRPADVERVLVNVSALVFEASRHVGALPARHMSSEHSETSRRSGGLT
jgi:hypothetical protein